MRNIFTSLLIVGFLLGCLKVLPHFQYKYLDEIKVIRGTYIYCTGVVLTPVRDRNTFSCKYFVRITCDDDRKFYVNMLVDQDDIVLESSGNI